MMLSKLDKSTSMKKPNDSGNHDLVHDVNFYMKSTHDLVDLFHWGVS